MSFEAKTLRKTGVAVSAASLAVLTACGGASKAPAEKKPTTPVSQSTIPVSRFASSVMLKPNLSGFTANNDATKCFNGGARPCVAVLREQPTTESSYVVAYNAQNEALWPKEAYGSEKGDAVKVVCQVKGQLLADYRGDPASDIWNVVEVPLEDPVTHQPRVNDHVKAQLNLSVKPDFGVNTDKTAIYAYGSVEWFGRYGDTAILPQLPLCTAQENPGDYPPAQ